MKQPYRYPNTRWNYVKLFGGTILIIAGLSYCTTSNDDARRACEVKNSKDTCNHYLR